MEDLGFNLDQLAKLTGRSKDVLEQELIKDGTQSEDAFEKIHSWFGEASKAQEQEIERIKAEALKAGARKRMSEFEDNIRKKYGITEATQGEKLIDIVIENQIKPFREKSKESDKRTPEEIEDFVKNSDYHKKVVLALNEDLTTTKSRMDKVMEEYEAEAKRVQEKRKKDKFYSSVKAKLDELNPVIQGNKEFMYNSFCNKLYNEHSSKLNDNDEVILLGSDGEQKKDDRYNPVTLDSLVDNEARGIFVFHKVNPGKEAPKGKEQPKGGIDWSNMTEKEAAAKLQELARDRKNPDAYKIARDEYRKASGIK